MAAFKCAPMVLGQLLKRPPGPEFADALAKIGGISIADTRWREGQHLELLPMIQTAAEAKTVDSREYVFAMLPLSKPSKRLEGTGRSVAPLTIDYSLTTEQVFQEAAKFIIDERQDLLLWWAERPPVGRKIFNMPSWVPDWTSKLPGGIAGPIKLSCEAQPSLRQWSDSIQPQKRITIEDNKLHLQAHKLDRIQTISRLFTYDNCRKLLVEQWKALPWGPSETTDKKAERFWRTIVLNVGGETNSPSTQAPPPRSLTASFLSIVAEERVLELLGCTMEQLGTDEAIRERARTHPECKAIGHQCGKGEAFEVLMRKNAIGRRFFTTESGGLGMTAFEEVNSTLKAARDALQAQAADTQGFGGMMMSSFQNFLKERDPAGAEAYAKAMGETEDERGAKVGDVIVAAVGGFHPYVLRQAGEDAESSTDSLRGKEFTYIGDCYLHGVMKGEPFAATNWLGRQSWRTDITVEDIRIV
ncbi:MAG: hypothetical protein INR71_08765 [Terriglobus roseus]|nr:hypothetical protein [Terriglobus roseus]